MDQNQLSQQQKIALGWIYAIAESRNCRKKGYSWMHPKDKCLCEKLQIIREFYLLSKKRRREPTRSESASFSRSIRKLWEQKLIVMYNLIWPDGYEKSTPSTHIALTEKGMEIARTFRTEEMKVNLDNLLK